MTPVVPIEAIIFYMEIQILLPGASGGEGERERKGGRVMWWKRTGSE